MSPPTRHALPSDRAQVTQILTEAFRHDPLWCHLVPERPAPPAGGSAEAPLASAEALAEFMAAEFDNHLSHGHTYLADSPTGGRAAALWTPPGVRSEDRGLGEILERYCRPETWSAAIDHFLAMAAIRPEEPHFYLALIGATDEARGRGLGSALLGRVLHLCDVEGINAHLESSNPRNISLYERHGFEVLAEIEFAPGVVVAPMGRSPR